MTKTQKKVYTLVVSAAFYLLWLIICKQVFAFHEGLSIYTEQGGMGLIEKDISEGHKWYSQFGISYTTEKHYGGNWMVSGEYFFRGEPADENPEILQQGANLAVDYYYDWKPWIKPRLGVEASSWWRDNNDKYGPDEQDDEFHMCSAKGGARFEYGIFWLDAGTIIPFWTVTKSGNFGIDSGIGVTFFEGGLDIGYRYKRVILSDHHFSNGNNNYHFTFSGIELRINF